MGSAEERLLKATKVKATIVWVPARFMQGQVTFKFSHQPPFISKLSLKHTHGFVTSISVSPKSSSNYPGLSFTGRWHDPEAHAGLPNCVSETELRMTGASSLSSWLVILPHTSEQPAHLTRRGTLANWQRLSSSKLIAEVGKALMWADPSGQPSSHSQFANRFLSRHRRYTHPTQCSSLKFFRSRLALA